LGVAAPALLGVAALAMAALIAVVLLVGEDFASAGSADPLDVAVAVTDSATGQALAAAPDRELTRIRPATGTPVIAVDSFDHLQHITGFGAALPDRARPVRRRPRRADGPAVRNRRTGPQHAGGADRRL
jgi:hypothetical protein